MLLFKSATYFTGGALAVGDIAIEGVTVSKIGGSLPFGQSDTVVDSSEYLIVPGFADVHVHLREPGFSYKEDIASATLAAASAGYTALCAMPNLDPVPDCVSNLEIQERLIKEKALVDVYPYGALTVKEQGERLSDIEALAPRVVAFSDDGRGVQSEELMRRAMLKCVEAGKILAAHCEDESRLYGGIIHDGQYARARNIKGISSESEWRQVERDIKLAFQTGCRYHVCHVSTKESVELIRAAKARGVKVTAETAPHYLLFCDEDLKDEGRFRMNPPIRSAADRDALVEGLNDGTIDIIATDHAPHSEEEKSGGLSKSLNGIIGLETAFPALYTGLVLTGKTSLTNLIYRMSEAPRAIFGLSGGKIERGKPANLAVLDLSAERVIRGRELLSKGSSTPFEGMTLKGVNIYTILNGEIIWKNEKRN